MKKVKSKVFNLALITIGALAIVFAIICLVSNGSFESGSYERDYSYGGDAYTGIQNAAAQAANNILYLTDNIATLASCVKLGFGFSLLIAGLAMGLCGAKGLLVKEGDVCEETVGAMDTMVEAPKADLSEVEEFKKAKALFDAGYLTQEEFELKKKSLLGL